MKKLGYIRTSTDKQLADRQIDQLHKVCDQVFIEDGVSAVGKKRPVYETVMTALSEGDVFVVVALDRAYRSVIDALTELDKIHQRGIAFCSLSQNFDTRTPEGKLLYTVSAALAEWERAILRQRTREGMAAAKLRGSKIGRPKKLSSKDIAWAKTNLNQAPYPTIADLSAQLNVSPSTLRRALRTGAGQNATT
ncbi:MAG: recombinase family protein [Psychrosphaera sp.]|nr:recombinase family protein [Psychrosphaera sp.]